MTIAAVCGSIPSVLLSGESMSFEYSSSPGNQRFSPPNPLKIENYFVGAAGAIMLLAGILLLFVLRAKVHEGAAGGEVGSAVGGLLVGALLIGIGATMLGLMAAHLRFWFGRDRPGNLDSAKHIADILRQRALAFPEPKGALNGLLYSWIPDLIFSPMPLQRMAQRQFRNALTMVALFISLCVAIVGGKVGMGADAWARVADWVGLIYLLIAGYLLFDKLGFAATEQAGGVLQRNGLVFLIVFSIIGPLFLSLVARSLPPLSWLPIYPHIFVMLLMAIVIYSVFLFAVLRQTNAAPQTEVSMEQQAWSINCQPGLIMGEFDRVMQDNWREKIPNRVYWHQTPEIDLRKAAGNFHGGAVEETQPMMPLRQPLALGVALRSPRHELLVTLDGIGVLCFLVAAAGLFMYGLSAGQGAGGTALLYGLSFLTLGSYALRAAHRLWKRFDFESEIVWIEMEGSYVSAKMDHGNMLNDTIKTSSSVVQIESMTFRVWAAAFDTVTFGVDSQRYVVSTKGRPEMAHNLMQHLHHFAQNQAMIVAPTARRDIERHAVLAQMNHLSRTPEALSGALTDAQKLILSGAQTSDNAQMSEASASAQQPAPPAASPAVQPAAPTAVPTVAPSTPAPAAANQFCTECGTSLPTNAAFCSACGARVAPA